jgi:hypothetical protein
MTEYLFRKRKVKCHKEYGPINGVESENILTDDVDVAGPIFLEFFGLLLIRLIGIVSESCDIVGQRVKPYVGYVLGIKINGNTPLEGCTGNAEVLKSALYLKEIVDHFLLA